MRKLASVAVLGALSASASQAMAQSSVTLYGLVDGGLSYVSNLNGAHAWQATTGKASGSRFGLRGTEDLGGGLSAVFTLENGFNVTNGTLGQAGRLFGRQAFVGLSSNRIGTITFGRQYDAIADLVAPLFGPGFWSTSAHIGDNDNLNQFFRLNNTVKVRSINFYGFSAEGVYSFSNQAAGSAGTGFGNNRAWALSANYVHGPFSIGAGYLQLDHPNAVSNTGGAVGGASTSNGDDYSSVFFYGMDGGVRRQRIFAAGTSYVFGSVTAGLGYSLSDIQYNDGAARRLNNYEANLRYQLTPAVQLIGVYAFTDGHATNLPGASSDSLHPKWHQFTLGADYLLSKRTDIYVSAVYQKATGDASTLVNGEYRTIASIVYAGTSSSASQVAVFTGIRHRF
ncbi:porin [Paraburkholderia sp.]|uniref:porin n=1 Tax=Paraburkholderia sp. TaxID=1926495 RepID=UPI0039E2E378